MSDPTRLGDPRSKGSASLRRLIHAGRSDLPDTERVKGLASRLGFGPGAMPAGAGAPKATGASLGGGTAAKVGAAAKIGMATKIGAVAVVVLGGGAGVLATSYAVDSPTVVATASSATAAVSASLLRGRDPERAIAAPDDERSIPPVPPVETPDPEPAASSGPTLRAAPGVAATASARGAGATGSPPLAATADTEVALLERAQRALGSDPQRALDLTDLDAKRFPAGALAQEREVIAIDALGRLDRPDDARARANQFFQAFPGSAHGPRVAGLVDLDASPDPSATASPLPMADPSLLNPSR